MDSRGTNKQAKNRLPIPRRSCDQCRLRKIACDRSTPCSSCVSVGLDCTRSAVAVKSTPPRHRVLISAEYEQKIDGIAKGIDAIQRELQSHRVLGAVTPSQAGVGIANVTPVDKTSSARQITFDSGNESRPWDHSAHIRNFIKAVVEERPSNDLDFGSQEVIHSLKRLLHCLERPAVAPELPFSESTDSEKGDQPGKPPLEAAVDVLRFAKDHSNHFIISLLSRVLPFKKFAEICRKVYFAVDDYTDWEALLANGYLSYIFSEHVIASGRQDYALYSRQSRSNFRRALSQLPLLLPACIEVVAVLTLGTFDAIESSKATTAWTFISAAANLCQTLGYHRSSSTHVSQDNRGAQTQLFWTMYKMEKSLALRLGRASTIRDSDITLPIDPNEPRFIRLGRIQGKVYDRLYSPQALSNSDTERGNAAQEIAGELRIMINETRDEILVATSAPDEGHTDPLRVTHLQCDLISQNSLLSQVLRATPPAHGQVSDECVEVAREVLEIHHQLILGVGGREGDGAVIKRYLNWAIINTPFVPFSILFTRAIQLTDLADLERLDQFAASLRPEAQTADIISITHPYRLYELLCRAARLYINSNTTTRLSVQPSSSARRDVPDSSSIGLEGFPLGMETGSEGLEFGTMAMYDLSEWYYDNQQVMGLLDGNVEF